MRAGAGAGAGVRVRARVRVRVRIRIRVSVRSKSKSKSRRRRGVPREKGEGRAGTGTKAEEKEGVETTEVGAENKNTSIFVPNLDFWDKKNGKRHFLMGFGLHNPGLIAIIWVNVKIWHRKMPRNQKMVQNCSKN